MKIGIITQPLSTNYGGVLQNYALQILLKQLGHDSITLRESCPIILLEWSYIKYFIHWCYWTLLWIRKRIIGKNSDRPLMYGELHKRYSINSALFENFISTHINSTKPKDNLEVEDVMTLRLDGIIVGSDQVWRPSYSAHMLRHQFLKFVKSLDIKKIAYAASFGVAQWEYTEEETELSRQLIKKFNAVSVRERSGLLFCRDFWNVNATWVLDPVMMLSKEYYYKLCQQIKPCKKRFIFAYFLSLTEDIRKAVLQIGKEYDCEILFVDSEPFGKLIPVEQWIASFRDAQYVLTDSFHGSVFSIVFEKDFLCLYNLGRGKARVDSLQYLTKLEKIFVHDLYNQKFLHINYVDVRKRIEELKVHSLSFLLEVLNR